MREFADAIDAWEGHGTICVSPHYHNYSCFSVQVKSVCVCAIVCVCVCLGEKGVSRHRHENPSKVGAGIIKPIA